MTVDVAIAVDDVGQKIIDRIGIPKDEWEIAAQLEVMGLRDGDARATYGAHDLFEIARYIFATFQSGGYRYFVERPPVEKELHPVVRFVRDYLDGLTFSLPMALQALTMLVWGYGLWGATDLDLHVGTSIALGFIASYVLAGGFSQAIVRRGLFYMYQQEESLARWTVLRGWSIAVRFLLALLIPALLFNAVFKVLPWTMMLTAAAYYAALSILWINWSLIYLVRKTDIFLGITALSLAVVIVVATSTVATAVQANMAGLITADILSFAVALLELNKRSKKEGKPPINPPRLTVLVYSTSRFFMYGLLYNAFLFADRVMAWTSFVGREDLPPYAFWLNVRYELGMDLALIVIMLLSGVVEYTTRRFSDALVPSQKATASTDAASFVDNAWTSYQRRRMYLAAGAPIAVLIAVTVAWTLRQMPNLRIQESLQSGTTMKVFIGAAIGYVIFMFALQNILLLLTLGRVELVVKAVGIALAVNLAVGFVASRAVHYWAAVWGLIVGAAVLEWLTARIVRKVLGRLDYHYYAGF